MKWRSPVIAFAAGAAVLGSALGAGRVVEDIQVSKRGEQATITVELACPMRLASDARAPEGTLVEVRVKPLEACGQLGSNDISSEAYQPVGGRLALLSRVEYESLGLGENLLIFHFDQPVDYRVAQRGDLRTLQLLVRVPEVVQDERVPTLESAAPPAKATAPSGGAGAAPSAAPGAAAAATRAPSDRAPLTQRVRAPAVSADYIVNLVSQREPFAAAMLESLAAASGSKPYVSEAAVDGQTWYRLRIGFYRTEQEARTALAPLLQQFPKAWVGRAEAKEIELASSSSFGTRAPEHAGSAPPTATAALATAAPAAAAAPSPSEAAELEQQGRDAMLAADYASAIEIYTRLLEEPGDGRADAREYLGLARERSGQTAQAVAEYRAYLEQYPEGEGARRVQQRLNGLTTTAVPREALRPSATDAQSAWNVATGLSQYYRRDVYQFDEFEPQVVALDALLTDVDVRVRHNGDTVNVAGRLVVSNIYDLSSAPQTTIGSLPDTPNRFSYAYVDVSQVDGAWQLRSGRQTLHNWGVLGRFDGLHFAYSWAPDRRVHFFGGYPVESTRYGLETSREFYGVSVDFDRLIGRWGFSTSLNTGTIDGLSDRQSFGFETRYADDKRTLTSMVDYDYGYDKLNTVLALGTWRFDNRLTLTGLVDVRQSPILTTRNALVGQPFTSISDMLGVYSEDQIRQIARDRTSDMTTLTLGVSKPLFERFQINADVTATEIGATVASAGVPAIPSTGRQVYYTTSFVGSGLFGARDVNVFNLRYGSSPDFTLSQVTWDVRLPIGQRLRINPRLTYGVWDGSNGIHRETTSPSFRVLLSFRSRYHFEAELGKDDFLRTDVANPTIRESSVGNYVNIGYHADF